MHSRKWLWTLLIFCLLAGNSCTHYFQTLTADERGLPATKSEDVALFFPNETPNRAFDEVGYIIAEESNEEDAVKFLKEKAAKMGADGIVNCEVRVHRQLVIIILFIPIFQDTHIASGVAVKYTNDSLKGGSL